MNEVMKQVTSRSSKRSLFSAAALAIGVLGATTAHAAPNQVVVVVAQGLSPQVIDLGSTYVKTSATEDEPTIGFNDLKVAAKTAKLSGDVVASMRGILKTAEANGYKTGLVTTNDVTTDAAAFYDITSTNVADALIKNSGFDFLAGGGRTQFVPATGTNLTTAFKTGNTALLNADEFENVEEIKGRVLALQADENLSYAIDGDAATEAGLGDLASLAMTTLAGEDGNSPFFLVVHDANLLKALNAKDTPAVLGEFRELDGIVTEALSVRDGKETPASMALAVVTTGASVVPDYTIETPTGRSNAIFIASKLPFSYAKATTALKGATEESIDEFAFEYGSWKPSADVRAAVIAGTTTGEVAVRSSFEPAISIGFEAKEIAPMAYVVGISETDLVAGLAKIAATKAK